LRGLHSEAFRTGLAVIVLAAVTTAFSPAFLSASNLLNITRNASFTAMLALGSMVVLLGGGLDVSIGSVLGLAGIVCAYVMAAGHGLAAGLAAAVLVSVLCGTLSGMLIARMKLSPLVVTIALLALYRSLALIISRGQVFSEFGPDTEAFLSLGGSSIGGIPSITLVSMILALVLFVLLRYSVWGMHVHALGSNEAAALANGVRTDVVKVSTYVVGALLAGLTGVFTVSWLGGVTSDLGSGYELNAIAAAVIGGTSLSGGRSSVAGTLLGSLLFEVIRNSLILLGVDALWQGFFVGAFILVALVIDRVRRTQS